MPARITIYVLNPVRLSCSESRSNFLIAPGLSIGEYLLDQGACIEARSGWEDMTALHYAAYFDCPRLAELLVMRGANLLARCTLADGATPLHMAASQLSLGTARLLVHLPLMIQASSNGDAVLSPLTCKEALDLQMRTPYGKQFFLLFTYLHFKIVVFTF